MVRRGSGGFTLLEVMVALAVVAIALGAIIKGASDNAATAGWLRDRTLAHFVAMNQVAELQLAQSWPAPGKRHGDVELAHREWRWQAEISATSDDRVRKLELTVALSQRPDAVLDHLTAFLPKPRQRKQANSS